MQAIFGIVQYLTANGKFVWIYQHPFRDTYDRGDRGLHQQEPLRPSDGPRLGPLGMSWSPLRCRAVGPADRIGLRVGPNRGRTNPTCSAWTLALGIVLLAGLMTLSRGGALAMLVATLVVVRRTLSRRSCWAGDFLWPMRRRSSRLIGVSLTIHGYHQRCRTPRRLHGRLDRRTRPRRSAPRDLGCRFQSPARLCLVRLRRRQPSRNLSDVSDRFLGSRVHPRRKRLSANCSGDRRSRPGAAAGRDRPVRPLVPPQRCRRASIARSILCAAAVAAGLAASVVHSLVDFVWYIPSLVAITALLTAGGLSAGAVQPRQRRRSTAARRRLGPRGSGGWHRWPWPCIGGVDDSRSVLRGDGRAALGPFPQLMR